MMADQILAVIDFLPPLWCWELSFENRHRERLALIQYGKDSSVFHGKRKKKNNALKMGLLFMSIGAGLLVGIFLTICSIQNQPVPLPASSSLEAFHWFITTNTCMAK